MAKQNDDVQRPSNDSFWSEQGRKKWPQISEDKVFLGQAVTEVGELLFGHAWSGKSNRPADDDFLTIQNKIAIAAADGRIQVYALDPKNLEYIQVPPKEWRLPKLLNARFARCSINCSNFRDTLAISENHGPLFVDRQTFSAFKTTILPTISKDEIIDILPNKRVSLFLIFLIHYIRSKGLAEEELPPANVVAKELREEWHTWRGQIAGKGAAEKIDPLSFRMADSMATILKGETARKVKWSKGRR